MATTSPQPSPTQDAQYRQLLRYTSIGALVLCPIIIALPPRKFDFYTVGLLIGTGIGANQTCREFTGLSIGQRLAIRVSKMSGEQLPSQRAREVQKRLREEKEARSGAAHTAIEKNSEGGVLEAVKAQEEKARQEQGLLKKIWMGDETEDWKAKRDAREKEALEDGRGYGGLITDQIWEVWNWGKGKAEDIKEIDEKVVEEKNQEKK
jgi:hypothetical protein